jgi:hypothetical protein
MLSPPQRPDFPDIREGVAPPLAVVLRSPHCLDKRLHPALEIAQMKRVSSAFGDCYGGVHLRHIILAEPQNCWGSTTPGARRSQFLSQFWRSLGAHFRLWPARYRVSRQIARRGGFGTAALPRCAGQDVEAGSAALRVGSRSLLAVIEFISGRGNPLVSLVALNEPPTHRRRHDMNFLSRRSVLAIAAVVDVALHSRSVPVAAKDLAARHKLPPPPSGDIAPGLGPRQDPQGRARAARRL